MSDTRVCRVCQQAKPMTGFAVYNSRGNRRHECLACMNHRREKYAGVDWTAKARTKAYSVSLQSIYAGPGHCWCCRRSVKNRNEYALCASCKSIKWERP